MITDKTWSCVTWHAREALAQPRKYHPDKNRDAEESNNGFEEEVGGRGGDGMG